MKTTIWFRIFTVLAVIYILATAFKLESFYTVMRPILPASVLMMYLEYKRKRNWVPVFLLSMCILGHLLQLIPGAERHPVILFPMGITYMGFIIILFMTLKNVRVKKLLYSALPVIVLWFVYYNYSIKDIFGKQMGSLYWYSLVYSLILSFFMISTLVRYFNRENKMNLYTVIIALSFLITDIMEGLHRYIIPSTFLKVFSAMALVISYYFFGRFVTEFIFERKRSDY